MHTNKSMVIFRNWADMVRALPDEQAGALSKAIFDYGFDGKEPTDPIIYAMFLAMKDFIDINSAKYEAKVKRAEEARDKKNSNINIDINSNIKSVNDNDNVNDNSLLSKDNNSIGRFIPPTREQVQSFINENGYQHVNADDFINFYEAKGWMIGKNKMKKWESAVSGWESRHKEKSLSKKNQFNDFQQRDYDYEELERLLVQN